MKSRKLSFLHTWLQPTGLTLCLSVYYLSIINEFEIITNFYLSVLIFLFSIPTSLFYGLIYQLNEEKYAPKDILLMRLLFASVCLIPIFLLLRILNFNTVTFIAYASTGISVYLQWCRDLSIENNTQPQ